VERAPREVASVFWRWEMEGGGEFRFFAVWAKGFKAEGNFRSFEGLG